MKTVLRFWISVTALIVSVSAVGYLFVSFLFPETTVVIETTTIRLLVTFIALIATSILVWSVVFADSLKEAS